MELSSAVAYSTLNVKKNFFHSRKDQIEERLGKYESNETSRSKSHISTSEHY